MPKRTVRVVLAEPANKKDARKVLFLAVDTPLKKSGTVHVRYKQQSGSPRVAKGSYEGTSGSTTFKFTGGGDEISIQCFAFNGELEDGIGLYESPHHLHTVKWALGSKDFG